LDTVNGVDAAATTVVAAEHVGTDVVGVAARAWSVNSHFSKSRAEVTAA
jgi:hypothetical protein